MTGTHTIQSAPKPAGRRRRALRLIAVVIAAGFVPAGRAQEPDLAMVDAARLERAARARAAVVAGLDHVPGEVLVRFRSNLSGFENARALGVLGASIGPRNMRWIGDTLHLTALGVDAERAADDLGRQPEVAWAQPNYLLAPLQANDPGYARQWNLPAIDAPGAWEINARRGDGVVVAVLDSGLTTTQGAIGFRIWTGSGFGVFSVPFAPAVDFDHTRVLPPLDLQLFGGWVTTGGIAINFDADGHGTHVAATIAQQTNNGSGFAGVASGVQLLPIKVCYAPWDVQLVEGASGFPGFVPTTAKGCDVAAVAEGLRAAADQGAKVINMSLGGPMLLPAVQEALRYAVNRGAFVAIAAGNDARSGNPAIYPAAYAPAIDGVVAVGAVTPSLARAVYSSHGSYVEIAAPGGAGSGGPPQDAIFQVAPNQLDLNLFRLAPAFNRYEEWGISGTSMASPHVAAVAALLYSQGVKSPAAIEAVLEATARDIGPSGRDDEFGAGLVDARRAIFGMGVTR